jgi:pseudaminic acid cytidylyltransferase
VPVTTYPYPIQRALCLNESGRLQMIDAGNVTVRSQDLVEAYHDAGQFYWGRRDAWIRQQPILSTSSAPLIIPRHRVQDIDTLEDFERAELLFRALRQSEPKKETNYG